MDDFEFLVALPPLALPSPCPPPSWPCPPQGRAVPSQNKSQICALWELLHPHLWLKQESCWVHQNSPSELTMSIPTRMLPASDLHAEAMYGVTEEVMVVGELGYAFVSWVTHISWCWKWRSQGPPQHAGSHIAQSSFITLPITW